MGQLVILAIPEREMGLQRILHSSVRIRAKASQPLWFGPLLPAQKKLESGRLQGHIKHRVELHLKLSCTLKWQRLEETQQCRRVDVRAWLCKPTKPRVNKRRKPYFQLIALQECLQSQKEQVQRMRGIRNMRAWPHQE